MPSEYLPASFHKGTLTMDIMQHYLSFCCNKGHFFTTLMTMGVSHPPNLNRLSQLFYYGGLANMHLTYSVNRSQKPPAATPSSCTRAQSPPPCTTMAGILT